MADSSPAAPTSSKHTPGPWHASDRAPKHLGGVIVVHSSGARPATGVAHAWTESDAALIAAAPELLAALAALLPFAESRAEDIEDAQGPDGEHARKAWAAVEAARAALEKAEGRAS